MLQTALNRVSVNRWTNFHNISYMQNAVWTIFEQIFFQILRGGGKLEKSFIFLIRNFLWNVQIKQASTSFDRVWLRSVFEREKFRLRKNISIENDQSFFQMTKICNYCVSFFFKSNYKSLNFFSLFYFWFLLKLISVFSYSFKQIYWTIY